MDNSFKIKFDGQLNQVDAQTFIDSLVNVSLVIQEINHEVSPGTKIEIKIKALDKGSFIAHLVLQEIVDNAQQLFTRENMEIGANVVTILGGVYGVKKLLGSKKPKTVSEEGDEIKIENEKGAIIFVNRPTYNIYTKNQEVNDAISNNFATLENDLSISSFEFLDEQDKPFFKATREEFGELAVKSEVVEENKKSQIVVTNLTLHKIVFENKYKWEFWYQGNKISASIMDEEFYKRIDKGERFAKGDSLKAELQINQIFDPAVNIFTNHSYEILKVHEHIPRVENKQMKITDTEQNLLE